MRNEIILSSRRIYCECGMSMHDINGMLFCRECLMVSSRSLADILSACRWRGRDDWSAKDAAGLAAAESKECRSIYVAVRRRVSDDRIAECAALWCSFRDLALEAVEIYGRSGIEEYGRRYHWRWAVHRIEWSAGRHLGRVSDDDRELGWDAMNAAWGPN